METDNKNKNKKTKSSKSYKKRENKNNANNASKKPNYYIFRVEEDNINKYSKSVNRITMKTFFANNDDEAYIVLNKYKREANPAYKYYYGDYHKIVSVDKNGKKKYFNTSFESFEDYCKSHNTIWHKIKLWFGCKKMRYQDFVYGIKDIFNYIRHKHSLDERFDIFAHMLDDLEYNIPKLIEQPTVPAYFEQIAMDKNKGEKEKEKAEFFSCPSRAVWEVGSDDPVYTSAKEMWVKELNNILEEIRIYRYYDGYGIIDEKDDCMKAIQDKYSNTLPYLRGRYKELDYRKLDALREKAKNRVFDYIRKYAEELNS